MTDLLAPAAVAVGKEVFKKTLGEIYGSLSKTAAQRLRQWNIEAKIETLYVNMSLVRRVKTIWQVDKPVDLSEFYCDSHVVINKQRKTIKQLSDFGPCGNLLIEGIAGQGKSIFLRYLCAVELALGNCIPLFVELRRVDSKHSLRNRIYAAFAAMELKVDDELYDALAASGKILLMLDAFDEVPEDLKSSVLTDIEDLASQHKDMRIVLTSRPEQTVRASSHFSIVTLDNLRGDEYAQVVNSLSQGEAWAEVLVAHVEQRASHIKPLLCTPLMVTLLVLQYKAWQSLPTTLSGFYEALFQTLLQRHDGTKPGYTRQRRCKLDDTQYRSIFEAVCIFAKKSGQTAFTATALHNITKEALAHCEIAAAPTAYFGDITHITCLILHEGDEYRFIHKTVQEYYTAAFIRNKPEPWAKDFYDRFVKRKERYGWEQELRFLSEIDSYRYNRYYWLPSLLGALGITEKQLGVKRRKMGAGQVKTLIGNSILFGRTHVTCLNNSFSFLHTPIMLGLHVLLGNEFPDLAQSLSIQKAAQSGLVNQPHGRTTKKSRPEYADSVVLSVLLDKPQFAKRALPIIDKHFDNLFKNAKELSAGLRRDESSTLLDDLLA